MLVQRVAVASYGAGASIVTEGTSVTSVSPDVGTAAGGTAVTITGANFPVSPTVTFGGTTATDIVRVNATTITCTTPAHATGVVDVLVAGNGTGNQLFDYRPASGTTYASYSDASSFSGFVADIQPGISTAAVSTDNPQPGKTYSIKCAVTSPSLGGRSARVKYTFTSPKNPAYADADGVYFGWKQYLSTAAIGELDDAAHQMKLHLFRKATGDGQPGYVMAGIGSDFPPGTSLTCFIDNGVLTISGGATGITFGDGVWRKIVIWNGRDGNNGRAICWVDDVQQFDVSSSAMGTDDATDQYEVYLGGVVVETDANIETYIDELFVGNFYPEG